MNFAVLGAILAYVLIQFAIGAWVSRNIKGEADFIVAGRNLGAGLVAFSVFATWFGAEAIVVSAGEVYERGLGGALVDPFGYGGAVIVAGLLLAAPLWRRGILTFADMIRQRYSTSVEKLFVVLLLPGSLFWAAAQIRAFGQIVSSSSGMQLHAAIALSAILVAAYSVVGGLLADAITDVIQGLTVIVGLLVLLILVMTADVATDAAEAADASRFSLAAGAASVPERLEKLAITVCGSLVAVELISRFLGASSARAAAVGTVLGGTMYILLGLIPVYFGLAGPQLIPGLEEPEQIVPKLAERFMPGVLYALFAGALISAILSVVHAALHAPAAQLSHNIVVPALPGLSETGKLRCVRLAVLGLSIVAFALALSVTRIRDLVETASAFGSAGAFVVAMFGIFTRFGGPSAACAGLLSGMLIWALGTLVLDLSTPYLAGLAAALIAYVAVALAEGREPAF